MEEVQVLIEEKEGGKISYNIIKNGVFVKKVRGSYIQANRVRDCLAKDGSIVYIRQSLM